MPMPPDLLERRLRGLERSNRVLLTAVVALAAVFLTAAIPTDQSADLIRTERVQIVDDEGRVRIDLRHDAEETGLFILDDEGHTRLGAAQFAHGGGGYALHGPESKGAAVLYLRGDGSLTFYDPDGAVLDRFPARP